MLKCILALLIFLPTQVWGGVFVGFGQSSIATITYQSTQTNTSATSPLTITKPTSTADGDLLVLFTNSDDDATLTATGWTSVQYVNNYASADFGVWYKVASSEGASYDVTTTTASQLAGGIIRVTKSSGTWSLTDSVQGNRTSSGDIALTGITATNPAILICAWGSDDAISYSAAPADMTEAVHIQPSSSRAGAWYQIISSSTDYSKTMTVPAGGEHAMVCAAFTVN